VRSFSSREQSQVSHDKVDGDCECSSQQAVCCEASTGLLKGPYHDAVVARLKALSAQNSRLYLQYMLPNEPLPPALSSRGLPRAPPDDNPSAPSSDRPSPARRAPAEKKPLPPEPKPCKQSALWDARVQALTEFKSAHGHANVPTDAAGGLGHWVSTQRSAWSRGALSTERYRQLSAMGLVWDMAEEKWMRRFWDLCDFHTQHGHTTVSLDDPERPGLGAWCVKQRHLAKRDKLADSRHRRLQGLGFLWSMQDALWEQHYRELVDFKAAHGSCLVPRNWRPNRPLAVWVERVRAGRRRVVYHAAPRDESTISLLQEHSLSSIGFEWDPPRVSWDTHYKTLEAYHKEHGHLEGPFSQLLEQWIVDQRHLHATGCLSDRRWKRLLKIGFLEHVDDSVFATRLEQLRQLISAHGFDHTWEALEAVNGWLVPAQTTTVFPSQSPDGEADTVKIEPLLAKWYKRQKKQALNGTSRLTTEQQHSLSELGFKWNGEASEAGMVRTGY